MTLSPVRKRTLILLAMALPVLALFVYAGLRSGPLAPVPVTLITVESHSITPALFGIGTVEARYTHKIGPTIAGRVQSLDVQAGDWVRSGQILGEMDPIDLDDRIHAQKAAIKRAEAMLDEAKAKKSYAQTQAQRYQKVFALRSTSEEIFLTKQHELQIAESSLLAAQEELTRARADHKGLTVQRDNLRLVAPVDGLVTRRNADPGTTVIAGQSVVDIIDPHNIWVNTRFDQINASGLAEGLPAEIILRSHGERVLNGRVLRVEPVADAVTEEALAKISFDTVPAPLPPLGELAEVTLQTPPSPAAPTIPNAALHRNGTKTGVWTVVDGTPRFTPVRPGVSSLDGQVQILDGLHAGDQIIIYSGRPLNAESRIRVVAGIPE